MTTETMDDETFDTLFAEAVATIDKPADKPADTSEADAGAAAAAAAAEEAAQAAAGKTEEELAAEATAKTEEEAAAGKTPEELAAEAAAATATKPAEPAATKPAEPAAPAKETEEQKAAREALEARLKDYEPSEEEKKALAQFQADFPNEYAAMEARFKSVDRNIDQRVYKAVQDVLQMVYKDIAPVVQGYSADSVEKHFTTIRNAHKDYDAVIELVPNWIKTQPAYLQEAMQRVYDEGSTKDVIELVNQFKTATGRVAQPDDAGTTNSKTSAPADADDLTPVGTKRTAPAPKGAPDPNDYDGAFAEAAASK